VHLVLLLLLLQSGFVLNKVAVDHGKLACTRREHWPGYGRTQPSLEPVFVNRSALSGSTNVLEAHDDRELTAFGHERRACRQYSIRNAGRRRGRYSSTWHLQGHAKICSVRATLMHAWFDQYKSNSVPDVQRYRLRNLCVKQRAREDRCSVGMRVTDE